MQPDPNQTAPVTTDPTNFDHLTEAIDIQQWQMEIDNFIDETSTELNQIAKILDGGPIGDHAGPREIVDRKSPQAKTKPAGFEQENNSRPTSKSVNHNSCDRLASLKQKLASQIEENRDSE